MARLSGLFNHVLAFQFLWERKSRDVRCAVGTINTFCWGEMGDGGGQPVQGLPTSADMAKVHDPSEDSSRPTETSLELVSIFPVAAGDVQTVVDTT